MEDERRIPGTAACDPRLLNPFHSASAAARYAAGRPYFHEYALNIVRDRLDLRELVALAVDIGCGTGLSTASLLTAARQVIGLDLSAAMVAYAYREPRIRYVIAAAESLPLSDRTVDLVTLSCVYNWLDHARFLSEARRVVRPGGHLVFIGHGFSGRMRGCDEFARWCAHDYLQRFPPSPRSRRSGDLRGGLEGFAFRFRQTFQHEATLTRTQVIGYLMSMSNIAVHIDVSGSSADDAHEWIRSQIEPFFQAVHCHEVGAVADFSFEGHVTCLERSPGIP